MPKVRILAVGVAVVDIVMTVDEMPHRPEKYRAKEAAIVGGGCGANAAVTVARLGGDSLLAARLGEDAIADMIVGDLLAEGVDCRFVRRFKNRRSSFSSVFIDRRGERQIVNYRDFDMPANTEWLTSDMPDFDAVLADNRWTEGALAAMAAARVHDKPGIMDAEAPILDTVEAMQAASHVVFSAQGLRQYTEIHDLQEGLAIAHERLGGFVGVTDGARGVWWRDAGDSEHMPAFDIQAVDTLGAGDVWHGAFALALAERRPVRKALEFSNAAAALKCQKAGGRMGIPTRQETETFLKEIRICN